MLYLSSLFTFIIHIHLLRLFQTGGGQYWDLARSNNLAITAAENWSLSSFVGRYAEDVEDVYTRSHSGQKDVQQAEGSTQFGCKRADL